MSAEQEQNGFLKLARERHSCRSYNPDRAVPNAAVEYCLRAAQAAPSACNAQPWHFIVVRDPQLRQNICENGLLPGLPQKWLQDAPVIVALCAELNMITHKIAPAFSRIPYYLIDMGIVGEHFILAAAEQNLGTCWIGWFKEKRVKKILHVPRRVRVLSLISLGYPSADYSPRSSPRRELSELYSTDIWNGSSPHSE